MSETKNVIVLKALQDHLLSLKREDGNSIFKEVKILPWAFRAPEEILNYGTNTNLFPAACIIPGEEISENAGATVNFHITLLFLTPSFPEEEEALAKFALFQKALETLKADSNGKLPELAGGHLFLRSSSPEEFPGNFVGIMASLEVYYGR